MVEERHTSENASFTGYCVEFWHGDILLAVAATASPAAEALRAALRPSFETIVSPDQHGVMVKRKVA